VPVVDASDKAMCYNIQLEGDRLKVDFAKTANDEPILASGDRIVESVGKQLEQAMAAGELKGGNLLKIYGRISVLASYTIAHQVAHLYRAIAVSDTRLGAYVTVISSSPEYAIGSRIDFETGEVTEVPNFWEEPTFLIYWENDILIAKINNGKQVDGDEILRDAKTELESLMHSGGLPGGKQPLRINGRTTVLASFLIGSQLAHKYSSIAVFDPKVEGYVVTISHSPDYRVGQILASPVKSNPNPNVKNVKVVLCGPANAGKTVLRDGLKNAIYKLESAPEDFYAISGCPDNDGAFFSKTAQRYPELAKQLKEEYKAKFIPEFADNKAKEIQRIKNSLLLFDVGGKTSAENEIIMSEATHAVILAKTETDVIAWKHFCENKLKQALPIVAVIYSDYHGQEDQIDEEDPILTGKVHHLERGEDASDRAMVKALAKRIVRLTNR